MARDETARETESETSLLGRRSYLRLAGAAAASVAGLSATSSRGSAAESGHEIIYENFNEAGYGDYFTNTYRQGSYDERVTDPVKTGSNALRVQFPADSHYGMAATYDPVEAGDLDSEATELYANMWIRFSSDFTGRSGKLPGPANVEPGGGKGGDASSGTNGWSARMSFDASVSDGVRLGYYAYHMDQAGTYGDHIWGSTVPTGEWVKLGQYVKLNTASRGSANDDGQLKMWINDELQIDRSGMRFTTDSSLGCNYWFNAYFGGSWSSPQDQSVCFDQWALSTTEMPDISDGGSSGGGDGSSGDDPSGSRVPFELVSGENVQNGTYEFTVEGSVEKNLSAGDNAAEDNDSITDNGDGTVTVSGTSGSGYGDSYYVDGNITSADVDESEWTLRYDGSEVSVQDVTSPTVDRFEISKSETLGNNRMFSVRWGASDAADDLDTVEVVASTEEADVNFSVTDVDGADASGWDLFQFPVDTTLDVSVRVEDEVGNVANETKNVTL